MRCDLLGPGRKVCLLLNHCSILSNISCKQLAGYRRTFQALQMSSQYHIDVIAPSSIILFTIVYDIVSVFRAVIPSTFKLLWKHISSPFQNFLTLDDFDEPAGKPLPKSQIKIVLLCILGVLQSSGWLGYLVYTCVNDDGTSTMIKALLIFITWVRDLKSPASNYVLNFDIVLCVYEGFIQEISHSTILANFVRISPYLRFLLQPLFSHP